MEWFHELFSHLHHLDELVRAGGYWALFAIVFAETGLLIGFFLPGDSLLVTAGLVASQGALHIGWLLLLLCAAAVTGDSVGYAIGRHLGSKLYQRKNSFFFRKEHVVPEIEAKRSRRVSVASVNDCRHMLIAAS